MSPTRPLISEKAQRSTGPHGGPPIDGIETAAAVPICWELERLRLRPSTHFLESVEDTAAYMAAAHAVVHPTRWDACSLAVLEGMAAGRAVITTAQDGAAELITHGVNGLILSEANDAAGLADLMAGAIAAEQMGPLARHAAARYDLESCFATVAALVFGAMPGCQSARTHAMVGSI
jgi:glycosyltransferase involved in cell wall biosynthesis